MTVRTALAAIGLVLLAGNAAAVTVTNLDDSGDGSLRAAVAATPSGGIVDFAPGLTGTIVLATPITFSDRTISGPGADVVTVSGGDASQLFELGGATTIEKLTLAHGYSTAAFGGAVRAGGAGPHEFRDCRVEHNESTGSVGAAIISGSASLTVERCTFWANVSATGAGGVVIVIISGQAALLVRDSTFVGNMGGALGAGSSATGSLSATIVGSTFADNHASAGGAIGWITGPSSTLDSTIANTTFVGNTATEGSTILGMAPTQVLRIVNVTIVTPPGTGPALQTTGTVGSLTNTIIVGGSAACVSAGTIANGGHNLIGDATCGFGAGADGVDPKLDPAGLADHGGPTQTIALLDDSPARDAGDDAVCAASPVDGIDQRGIARPIGAHCDIGAFEAPTTTTTSTSTSTSTTTLPAGCPDAVTLSAVACRVDALADQVDALVPAGKIRTKLDTKLAAAASNIQKAVGLVAQGKTKPAGKAVKRALGAVRAFRGRVRSKAAGKVIASDVVTTLVDAAERVLSELAMLRKEPV